MPERLCLILCNSDRCDNSTHKLLGRIAESHVSWESIIPREALMFMKENTEMPVIEDAA